jgi:hypothetical protein
MLLGENAAPFPPSDTDWDGSIAALLHHVMVARARRAGGEERPSSYQPTFYNEQNHPRQMSQSLTKKDYLKINYWPYSSQERVMPSLSSVEYEVFTSLALVMF